MTHWGRRIPPHPAYVAEIQARVLELEQENKTLRSALSANGHKECRDRYARLEQLLAALIGLGNMARVSALAYHKYGGPRDWALVMREEPTLDEIHVAVLKEKR